MRIRIEQLCLGDACNLSLELDLKGSTLLYDPSEVNSAAILKSLVDPDAITRGGIYLDDTPLGLYYEEHLIPETFGYVFDAAIMLSNLSIRENLYLPYKIRFQNHDSVLFEQSLRTYMELFELELDLEQRPAFVRPAIIKQMCFIRSLILNPKVLLIDNPFYLLNRFERDNLCKVLGKLKPQIPMLIASTDQEFFTPFADQMMIFDPDKHIFVKRVAIS